MSDTSPSFDEQIAALTAQLGNSDPAATTNELLPTPIGVPKWKVDQQGNIMKDDQGKPIPWYVQKQVGHDVGTPDLQYGDRGSTYTSRVDPGSIEAQRGLQVHPKYWSHDAWTLIDAMAPEDVRGVQQQLIDTGLLKAKGTVAGNWTNKEANAFQQVLSVANQSGVTWDVALSHMAANGRANPPEANKVSRPQLEVSKANPFALRQIADKVSEQRIGRRLSDAESAKFVEWWGQHEDAANAEKVQVANAEANDTMTAGGDVKPGGGGALGAIRSAVLGAPPPLPSQQVSVGVHTLHDPMTPDQAAEQFIREQHPQEVSTTRQLATMNQFLNILGTSVGGGVPGRPGA